MRPIAVFDIDDTLADFAGPFAQYLTTKYNDRIFMDDMRDPDVKGKFEDKYPKLDIHSELKGFEATGAIARLPLISRVFEEYEKLRTSGHAMHLMTARGWMSDGEWETRMWAELRGVHFDKLHIVPLADCKSIHFPPNVAFYYDDHQGHMLKCSHLYKSGFLVAQKWNHDRELPANVERW